MDEHGPFIDGFPLKTSIYKVFSMAMLNNQMVILLTNPMTDPWCWYMHTYMTGVIYGVNVDKYSSTMDPMENGWKWPIYRWFTYYKWWFSMATLNNQMVILLTD